MTHVRILIDAETTIPANRIPPMDILQYLRNITVVQIVKSELLRVRRNGEGFAMSAERLIKLAEKLEECCEIATGYKQPKPNTYTNWHKISEVAKELKSLAESKSQPYTYSESLDATHLDRIRDLESRVAQYSELAKKLKEKIEERIKSSSLLQMPMVDLDTTSWEYSFGRTSGLREAQEIIAALDSSEVGKRGKRIMSYGTEMTLARNRINLDSANSGDRVE